jgi:hypothetical protein
MFMQIRYMSLTVPLFCYGTIQMMRYVKSNENGAYFKLTNLCFIISTLMSLFIQTLADINNLSDGLLLRIFKRFSRTQNMFQALSLVE